MNLRGLSVNTKLTLIALLTCAVAFLLGSAIALGLTMQVTRGNLVADLDATAQMTADNAASALSFNDAEAGLKTLSALGADPHLVAAVLYDRRGQAFVSWQNRANASAGSFTAPPLAPDGHRFGPDRIEVFRTIVVAGETEGALYLYSNLDRIDSALRTFLWIVSFSTSAALLAVFVLATRMNRVVAEPISQLSRIAMLAARGNYTVRAVRKTDDELGHLVDAVNTMLAQIQARDAELQKARELLEQRVARRTSELQQKAAFLEAQVNSSIDGILVVDANGRKLIQNSRMSELWKIPPEIAANPDDAAQVRWVTDRTRDPRQFLDKVIHLYAHPDEVSQDEIELTDGTVLDRYSSPVVGKDGVDYGRIWAFRDITARKQAEAELAAAHRELMETSRLSGMAEVATNVLHNVGNVLNSVNVSAGVILSRLKKSRIASLARVVELLRAHEGSLAEFFGNDPKGRLVPVHLAQLSEHLQADQAAISGELSSLTRNIDHIKEIVATQQSYARVGAVEETVCMNGVMEDCLRMNAEALARHGVDVVRDLVEVPPLKLEKHKLLQILTNLVSNALQACDESGQPDKRLTVRSAAVDGRVRVEVSDNGVGIPRENLSRIFSHGFTTKKSGHGFGLHASALAAQVMGGSLAVHSDGPGKGASFTLELPCRAP